MSKVNSLVGQSESLLVPPEFARSRAVIQQDPLHPLEMMPFIVRTPYDSLNSQLISLAPDDEGVVLYSDTNTSRPNFYYVDIVRKRTKGWVPARFIIVNREVRYGDISLKHCIAANLSDTSTHLDPKIKAAAEMPFAQMMLKELELWYLHADDLGLQNTVRNLIKSQDSRIAIVSTILNGCHEAGTLDTINRPDFSWETLSQIQPQANCDPRRGIYGNRYFEFPDKKKQNVARVGSAEVISRRILTHMWHRANRDGKRELTHYLEARQAAQATHFTICILHESENLLIVEQLFMNAFELYSPHLNFQQASIVGSAQNDDPEHAERWATFRRRAQKIMKISEQAKSSACWYGGCSRPSFGADYGVNVSSPLFEEEGFSVLRWTRFDIPGQCAVFSRPAYKATRDGHRIRLTRFRGHTLHTSLGDMEPKPGTYFYLQVEIMLNGDRHPYSYANLPQIPIWNNYHEANSVGFSIAWMDDVGIWHKKVLTFKAPGYRKLDQNGAPAPGVHMGYGWALAYKRYLMHETVENPAPWEIDADLGLALVYKASFDNFTQRITLHPMPMESTYVRSGLALTLDEVVAKLTSVGARFNPFVACRVSRGDGTRQVTHRLSSCDWCLCVHRQCEKTRELRGSLKYQCRGCVLAGLVCTYTRVTDAAGFIDSDDSPVEPDVAQYLGVQPNPVGDCIIDDPAIIACTRLA